MKPRITHLLAAMLGLAFTADMHAQISVLTYQGQLTDGGVPVTGLYDFTFTLYDSSNGMSVVGAPLTNIATEVSNGLFTVLLDFGPGVFDGSERWLEISAVTNAGGPFNVLSPRQPVTATPYAITAGRVTGPIDGSSIVNGTITSVQLAPSAVGTEQLAAGTLFNGAFVGDAGGLTNLDSSKLTGTLRVEPPLMNVGHATNNGNSIRVVLSGNYAYLASSGDGLHVYDISNPASPTNIGSANDGGEAVDVVVSGNFAYLANYADGLRVYNISNPASPIIVGYTNDPGDAFGVAVSDNYAYLANGADGLRVYDISNPANPINVGHTNDPGYARFVTLSGNYAYVACESDGLRVYDISNPSNPINIAHVDDGGNAYDVAVSDHYAYLANKEDGLRVYEVSDPSNPVNVGHIDDGGAAWGVAVSGNYAYLANADDGLRLYDISDPANPANIGHVDDGGNAYGVVVSGNSVYLANDADGLRVYAIGSVNAPRFTGDGRGLSGLNADQLTYGTVPSAQLFGTYSNALMLINVSNTFSGNFDGAVSGDGFGITNVNINLLTSGALTWGTFTRSSLLNVSDNPRSIAAADVNGDGHVDLFNANAGNATLTVFTNNGSDGFGLLSSPSVGNNPNSVASADVNGDDKLDLLSANTDDNTLSVLTNNGSGGFGFSSSPAVGNGPRSITVADINSDGQVDLISANAGTNTLTVLTNNGSGGFELSSSPSVGLHPYSVAAADVNGDGDVDLISANYDVHTLSVLTNDGNGRLIPSSTPNVGNNPRSVAAADVNGDGHVDLISANAADDTLSVLTNNGSGNFELSSLPMVGDIPYSVTAADVNGDGHVDLINASVDTGNLDVLTNSGSGSFALSSRPLVSVNPVFVTTADVNGDGHADLISAGIGDGDLTVLINTPVFRGRFSGDGSGLNGLNAGSLTSGTVSSARLSGTYSSALIFSNVANRFTGIFSGDGSGLTGIHSLDSADGSRTNALYVDDAGNVGIGTTTPEDFLHIFGGSAGSVTAQSNARLVIEDNNGAYINILTPTNSERGLLLGDPENNSKGGVIFNNTATRDGLQLRTGGNSTRLAIDSGGNVGIGTTAPESRLDVRGSVISQQSNGNNANFVMRKTGAVSPSNAEFALSHRTTSTEVWMYSYDGTTFRNLQEWDHANYSVSFPVNGATLHLDLANSRVGIGTNAPSTKLEVAGEVKATVFTPVSDRRAKENFQPVSATEVLKQVVALPITRWNFKSLPGASHIGPVAQDFHAAFGVGANETTISTVDADGVALAAIQGLNKKLEETRADLKRQATENAELKQAINELKELVQAMHRQLGRGLK